MALGIDELPEQWQAIALGAAMVSRMKANYALFAELTGEGDIKAFNSILNLVWEFAAGHNQRIDFQKQIDKLEVITPEPEKFDMYGVWPALDAAVALTSLLSCCERWHQAELESVLTLSLSTVEQYLDAVGDVAEGEDHLLLEAEESVLYHLLKIIRQQPPINRPVLVSQLKAYADDLIVSNIGLEC